MILKINKNDKFNIFKNLFFSWWITWSQTFSKKFFDFSVFVIKNTFRFFFKRSSFICLPRHSLSKKACSGSIFIWINLPFGIFSRVLNILYRLWSLRKKSFILGLWVILFWKFYSSILVLLGLHFLFRYKHNIITKNDRCCLISNFMSKIENTIYLGYCCINNTIFIIIIK